MSTDRDFELDPFQLDAIAALDAGHSVLVAAPTGSGKTVVAEAALSLALHAGGRAFYTTPIKALSNQKFHELRALFGADQVGLLTGDNSIAPDAPVVVMTTEVLRNMIYAENGLDRLHVVVLDEVHYLQDAYRGPVWEEVIIHLPTEVRLVCLSATVSNSDELGAWIETVRGPLTTVVETRRPVELQPLYLVGDRSSERLHLIPVLVNDRPNPDGQRFTNDPRMSRRGHHVAKNRRRFQVPGRIETIELLDDEDLLPAIVFIFSRNQCDAAVKSCLEAGLRLSEPDERSRIRAIADAHTDGLTDGDLDALGYDQWISALEMGIASHHAGMIPAFKEAVEACFVEGLIKVVFATETLALGINMPARSVVIERLTKYNGERHEFLSAGQFTQLTGRAGRRGIDDQGYAIVSWSPFVSFEQVAALTASRDFPLTSSFRPTYNMAANLIRRYDRREAYEVVGQSFAQFQSDRALVGLQRRLQNDRRQLEALLATATCDRGDIETYAALTERARRRARRHDGSRTAIEHSLSLLRPGDIVGLAGLTEDGSDLASVVISVAHRRKGSLRLRMVDEEGDVVVVDVADVTEPIHSVGTVELPTPYDPGDPRFLDSCAALAVLHRALLRDAPRTARALDDDPVIAELEAHPVHTCPDRELHLDAWAEAQQRQSNVERRQSRAARRNGSIARKLDAILEVLTSCGYAEGWSLTPAGQRLAAIYHESDLLVAQAHDRGHFDGLSVAGLAAVVSAITYEERRADAPRPTPLPDQTAQRRLDQLMSLGTEVQRLERSRGVSPTRLPDPGFAAATWAWAEGQSLADVVEDDIPAGDFVRNVKLLIDLLRQLGDVAADPTTRETARAAAEVLTRGVVAASLEVSDPLRDPSGPA